MTRNKHVSVIGCGWLGLPLANILIEHNFKVKGTTTTEAKVQEMQNLGIDTFSLRLPNSAPLNKSLFDVDFVVINFPPGSEKAKKMHDYLESIEQLLDFMKFNKKLEKLIFVSSTSVYSSKLDFINESMPANPGSKSGEIIREAEIRIIDSGIPYIILRFGGLAGPGRHPGSFLSGKTGLPNANQSINLLHQDDAIQVIISMLNIDICNEVFNVVAPIHPTKIDFYTKMADDIGLEHPEFLDESQTNKREISCSKLLRMMDFTFKYPDPMHFLF